MACRWRTAVQLAQAWADNEQKAEVKWRNEVEEQASAFHKANQVTGRGTSGAYEEAEVVR